MRTDFARLLAFFDLSEMKLIMRENTKQQKAIIVGKYDKYNLLGVTPNNEDEDDDPIISLPLNLSLKFSSLLSYSVCNDHSVLVTKNGSVLENGFNLDGVIFTSHIKTKIS